MDAFSQNGTSASEPRRLALLGATGSIGTQTLEVVRLFPDRFDVRVLTCRQNVERLAAQVQEFRPECVAVGSAESAEAFKKTLPADAPDVRVLVGSEGLCEAATRSDVDVVLGAVVGFAGLRPILRAVRAGKQVALANKETLVVGGALVTQAVADGGGQLLPVDSEHSAIFQCLAGESERAVEELVLTASGGPFWDRPADTFGDITVEEALDHPNWSMGAKITVDSATMMNKGLEVIEAKWLFDVPVDRIQVLVHPQSIVHSMVSFADGAVKAQLGVPDMKVPIQYALSYPSRWPASHERLDWDELSRLDFERPDLEKFPCLRLAYDALEAGGTAPALLNAANEAAVGRFLEGQLGFLDIPRAVERVLEQLPVQASPTLDDLVAADTEARRRVEELPLPTSN
ncbi:1-deoxy-D-xylulose-5-phosphate reductoisomerase [Salinibacter ruber]|uniref:1-deoxy-D-xylulose-5-phosphate reductoisomerase n=1 Tax=Salinibacter ruber TaxID=146919 RepID=UPI00216984E7|nr:1-deoxy-D-xylulose-5-phosphate reductoisomerase [Salinibacter ruber]MCS3683380.1 1-deoxy-D-xylulose-5-phosphate reductoisomerase [Salinibacter ruber]MCS3757523.1 1-deoxy-D-xylulose-5-phosphate reductoisomerase [Salinibacter ruber]MCS3956609.1 1-deoxy-D-xylulose-5-phosphate reductoisomerase [Salinibacter ruber]MCS4087955.1 1-deoxy-D-xylulose-5-phosphate reductoisomerase [Salinibacter ruber]MCS4175311.1 1-deoxy-D-xylulose-5-phosphate reductoisomerase [Salinibacter ruber]